MNCPYCNSPLPPDAPHCPACGAPTGVPQRNAAAPTAAMSDEVAEELQALRKERKKLRQLREDLEDDLADAEYEDDVEYVDEGPSELGKLAHIAGWILIVVGIADFAGMFLGYDFTGYPWTPIAFGVVGEILINLDL